LRKLDASNASVRARINTTYDAFLACSRNCAYRTNTRVQPHCSLPRIRERERETENENEKGNPQKACPSEKKKTTRSTRGPPISLVASDRDPPGRARQTERLRTSRARTCRTAGPSTSRRRSATRMTAAATGQAAAAAAV